MSYTPELSSLSDVSTSGASSDQVLKYNGSSWAPADDSTGGGGGGSRPTILTIEAAQFSGGTSYAIPDQGSSVMELVCLVHTTQGTSKIVNLPTAESGDIGLKIQVKRRVAPFTDNTCDYNNDPTITMDDTSSLSVGMEVTGTGIPAGSSVASITDSTTFELSTSTTGGAVTNGTLTFIPVTDPVSVKPYSGQYIDGIQNNSLSLTNLNSNLTFICTSANNWHVV